MGNVSKEVVQSNMIEKSRRRGADGASASIRWWMDLTICKDPWHASEIGIHELSACAWRKSHQQKHWRMSAGASCKQWLGPKPFDLSILVTCYVSAEGNLKRVASLLGLAVCLGGKVNIKWHTLQQANYV